jgi:uncharacterized damage-inducible protein DinB
VEGVPEELMPAAHSLMDALEDMDRAASDLTVEALWYRPGGAPAVGFHLRHAAGSTGRLLTYARGEPLSGEQLAAIEREAVPGEPAASAAELLADLRAAVRDALDVYRATPPSSLSEARRVGRAGLPSTVRGLLFHAAEHARRHAGQVVTTATVVRGLAAEAPPLGAAAPRHAALLEAAQEAWEDAGVRGLCAEGRWEVVVGVLRDAGRNTE